MTGEAMKQVLRDLIYFDFEKAASIFSQIEGGLLLETKSGLEGAKNKQKTHKLNIGGIYKPEFGGVSTEKTSQLESRILHHDLLVRIEEILCEIGIIVDINTELDDSDITVDLIRSELEKRSYIRAEGWASIEDYSMIRKIMNNFNDIADFLSKCQNINTSEFKELLLQLESLKVEASKGDKKAKSDIKRIESDLQSLIEINRVNKLDKWFIDGLNLFADTLMHNRINFRICPFENVPQFQVTGNLKRECFLDGNLENILSAYGIQPNVKLTIFGLITSRPSKDNREFKIPITGDEGEEHVETSFQALFNTTIDLQNSVRYSKYPSITVYPIALYHSIYTAEP